MIIQRNVQYWQLAAYLLLHADGSIAHFEQLLQLEEQTLPILQIAFGLVMQLDGPAEALGHCC